MGTVYEANCPECGYQKEFHIGSGLFALQLHRHLRYFDEKEQAKIQQLEQEKRIQRFQIFNQLGLCGQGKNLRKKLFSLLRGQIRKNIYLETIALTVRVYLHYMGNRRWNTYFVRIAEKQNWNFQK